MVGWDVYHVYKWLDIWLAGMLINGWLDVYKWLDGCL